MKLLLLAAVTLATLTPQEAAPRAGKVEILKASEVKPGMQATAWTVFQGSEPEAVPIEIIGLWKNAWGPKQDIILGKMGGKANRTNVAGGMSGSPVYVDGKLIGAVALRLSVFSPDAICGITPIELMLEINAFDKSRPAEAKAQTALAMPGEIAQQVNVSGAPLMVPIETPLTFSGFNEATMRHFGPIFESLGARPVLGGGGGTSYETRPAADWKSALHPGQTVTGVLVSGDMSVTGLGTVTWNDGKNILAFGHPFFNLGPVEMPMSKGEILMVLSSQFQPNKFGNAGEIVGALKQDRHSGIMGVLGEEAKMVPVNVKVRSQNNPDKAYRFNVFIQQRWTPYLMMVTLFNSLQGTNDFADDVTYRFSGDVELDGLPSLKLSTMQAPTDMPMPPAMMLAGWWGDKFNRLFLNNIHTPKLKSVNVTVDLIPERKVAAIDSGWASKTDVQAGEQITVKAFLRPYRGERVERSIKLTVPANLPRGEHRILLSDADTLNRMQSAAGMMNRFLNLPQTVSLINQERANNRLYVSFVESKPTVYIEDKALPNLPASVVNVLQASRSMSRPLISSGESAVEQAALPFDHVVTGNAFIRVNVR